MLQSWQGPCQLDKNAYVKTMITTRSYGHLPDGSVVNAYDIQSADGFMVTILSYGATLQSLTFPDGTDIVLGFDDLAGYLGEHPYFGPIIGRVANRIRGARFEIDGEYYDLPKNEGENNLHSGPCGFDRVNWKAEIKDETLILCHTSLDGHQGFPGEVKVELRFRFEGHTLSLEMSASTDKATPLNMTYHPYFNLTDGGVSSCQDHMLEINANFYEIKDHQNLTTGEIKRLACSQHDYRDARAIDNGTEYLDQNFIRPLSGETGMFKHAKLWSNTTGYKVIICSTLPCLQAYTGQYSPRITGKGGVSYDSNHGVALEPQGFIHDPKILRPGESYQHKISYTFRRRANEASQ